ncbi:tagatose 1,6-diphosphate aldolase [Enterococcus sp. 9D6_DIV0238]|uniref:Tagatose 1,6-diphosphate aldolase n=1 Tax=Candidatus Enterococcus dunnyi TaxID=1834192 RepID=A0A200JEI6_9ENTE|nr:tagatose 1,6-diphosphate aldolase [Enterococcus sp. 9D6_DIV0238]
MKLFSETRFNVDVLKVEVLVNMAYVEGVGDEVCSTKKEPQDLFKAQAETTKLPFIFLSAGVSSELFQQILYFAKESSSTFNGVLCGGATWKEGVTSFAQNGQEAAEEWLQTIEKEHIQKLNEVLKETATALVL